MDLLRIFRNKQQKQDTGQATSDSLRQVTSVYNFTYNTCADIIAKVISKCEFMVFEGDEPVKNTEYYKLNIEPNTDKNAPKFWYDVVYRILTKGDALVLLEQNQFWLATSFSYDEKLKRYTDIEVGERKMTRSYKEADVFYFACSDKYIKSELDAVITQTYNTLFARSVKTYKQRNAVKQLVDLRNVKVSQDDEGQKQIDKMTDKLKKLYDENDGIIGTSVSNHIKSADLGTKDSKDIESFTTAIIELVCMCLHIPIGIVQGTTTVTNQQMTDFLTFQIDPLCQMIDTEINRKYYKMAGFLNGNRVMIDVTRIKHVNILDKAAALDSLFRIGFSHNDLLGFLNKPPKTDAWADKHYVTKNYMDIENPDMKGGEENK